MFVLVSTGATPEARAAGDRAEASGAEVLLVEPGVFAKVSSTRTPQGVAAVFPLPVWTEEDVFRGQTTAALDGVSDPGNAGTVIRSAAAFGGGAVFLPGSAYPYGTKTTRASAGANIRLPIIASSSLSELASRHPDYIFAGADPRGEPLNLFQPDRPVCLVVGSEARGLSRDSTDTVACLISIPMGSGVESLNAGVSASIILHHLQGTTGSRRSKRMDTKN
jgi:TrmH family RNA methyltransferase